MKKGARFPAVDWTVPQPPVLRWGAILATSFAVALGGCKDEPPRGTPPPPPAAPATCAGGGGQLSDAASAPFFPRVSAGFCLDPNGGDKTYGESASLPLDKICDMFDGECEIYKDFQVRRVVELRYVDGSSSPATIDIHLSKFATGENAYAMFTKRVVGDGDPALPDTPKPTSGGGAAALGVGNAYLWRGLYLAEITYNDESAAEIAIKAAGEKLLKPLVYEIGSKLPGDMSLPASAQALPLEQQLPLGIRLVTKDALGVQGIGGGAYGYYQEGDKRYRILSMVRNDADQAKDILLSLSKRPGASKEKSAGDGGVRIMHKEKETPAAEWIFARRGKAVFGLGDEIRVLRDGMTAEESAKVSLSKDEKIVRLKKIVAPSP
jgi:hypothetical protein